jgi:hypothetical protein
MSDNVTNFLWSLVGSFAKEDLKLVSIVVDYLLHRPFQLTTSYCLLSAIRLYL